MALAQRATGLGGRYGRRPQAVQAFFAHEFEGARTPKVVSYELPKLGAINLHGIQALGGGRDAKRGGVLLSQHCQGLAAQFFQTQHDRGADALYREQDGPLVCWKGHAGLAQL